MTHDNRRTFLKTAGAAVIATPAFPVLGANDRINLAVVGIGGRGRDHINEFAKQPSAASPPSATSIRPAASAASRRWRSCSATSPRNTPTCGEVFEDKEIDAVSFATPNHWHALGTIWACQAGKDVYVEKPPSHNIFEGRKMIEAARKYNRIVQVGSQSRSIPYIRRAVELLGQGVIGKLYEAKGLCFNPRKSIGHTPDEPVPPGINWDMFLGPAPMRPFSQNRFHYNWHWFWDTGNGDIGNQGIHEMDKARWGLNRGLPNHVVSTGGKFVYEDDQETPNTQLATFDYGDAQHHLRRARPDDAGRRRRPARQPVRRQHLVRQRRIHDARQLRLPRLQGLQARVGDGREGRAATMTAPHMAQFPRRLPQPQLPGPQRRHRGRSDLGRPGALRQHQLPRSAGG